MPSDEATTLQVLVQDLRRLGGVMLHPDADPVLMDPDVITAYTGRHPKSVARAAKAGELPYIQSAEGGRIGYRLSALNAWLDGMSSGPTRSTRDDSDRPWDL